MDSVVSRWCPSGVTSLPSAKLEDAVSDRAAAEDLAEEQPGHGIPRPGSERICWHNGMLTYFSCHCDSQQHHPQNVELLSDTAAPRYGYESDEEDQLNPLLNRPLQKPTRVSIQGYPFFDHPSEVVIIASGEAGKAWAQGAQLGEQRAAVIVDELAVTRVLLMTTY